MRVLMLTGSILLLMSLLVVGQADAQPRDKAELIQENRALRDELEKQISRVLRLEAQVDRLLGERRALMGTLRQTEGLIAALRNQLGATDALPPPIPMAQTPADPLASPDSLLRELKSQYRVTLLSAPQETQAERAEFIKQLRRWCRLTHQNLRGKRTWLVRLEDMTHLGKDALVVRMTVLDEANGLPIGDAFDVQFPKRFQEQYRRGSETGKWELTSLVIAKPVFNESRTSRGVFEYPTVVGPMVEFDFELNWQGLRAWEPAAKPDQPEDEAEPAEESDAEPKT
ncbi:MAG: hypothetical protein COB69_03835 [Phycisphaera sp.]|nr:MAG: hypothetical protein COB69_03835 [Phycisphaera sp.]